ncbi:MAG: Ig-like domain-containing protein, partial [Eggerthellaceae bacterium]
MPFGASRVFEAAAANIPTELAVEPASLELNAGTSGKLKAVVEPAGSDGNVVWTSSNENVAKVLEDGTVKALSGGTVTITARSVANPALANVSVVTVVDARTVTFWTGTGEGEITSLATPTTAGSTILMPELPDGAVNNWPKDRVFVGWSVDKDAVASGGKDHYT